LSPRGRLQPPQPPSCIRQCSHVLHSLTQRSTRRAVRSRRTQVHLFPKFYTRAFDPSLLIIQTSLSFSHGWNSSWSWCCRCLLVKQLCSNMPCRYDKGSFIQANGETGHAYTVTTAAAAAAVFGSWQHLLLVNPWQQNGSVLTPRLQGRHHERSIWNLEQLDLQHPLLSLAWCELQFQATISRHGAQTHRPNLSRQNQLLSWKPDLPNNTWSIR